MGINVFVNSWRHDLIKKNDLVRNEINVYYFFLIGHEIKSFNEITKQNKCCFTYLNLYMKEYSFVTNGVGHI